MRTRLVVRFCISIIVTILPAMLAIPASAGEGSVEIHRDAGYTPPEETYFNSANTVYLRAIRAGYVAGICRAQLVNGRSGEANTLLLEDSESTGNYTASFIPKAFFRYIKDGDEVTVTVYMGGEQLGQRTIYIDNTPPIISTPGSITLTGDVDGNGVANLYDSITYTAGTVTSPNGDSWTVDLSAYGLSATAAPGIYAILAGDDDGAFGAVETVTDKAGNTASGGVAVVGSFKIDNIGPVISVAGTITLAGDVNGNGTANIGDRIIYTSGTVESPDGDSWRANLSAWGLSASAAPGTYTVAADNAGGTPAITETVTDNGGNTSSGAVSPAFTISDLCVLPEESYPGDRQYVHAVIRNTGGFSGGTVATLKINGVEQSSEKVILAAGASQGLQFMITMDMAGTHSVSVNDLSGTFMVKEKPESAPAPVPPAEPVFPSPPQPPPPPFQEPEPATPQASTPEPVNMPLVVIGSLAQSLVMFYIVHLLRKRSLHKSRVVTTT